MSEQESPMSPTAFLAAIKEIARPDGDIEIQHSEYDRLMEEILISLGYQDGIELMRKQDRWYA